MSPIPSGPNQPGVFPPSREPPYREPPARIVLERSGGRWFGRLGWLLFLIALVAICGMYSSYKSYFQTDGGIEEKFVSHSKTATDKVAIIDVQGVIMHNDGFTKWQIDRVRDDPNVKAIVLRIDSPGGTVTGSNYLYHMLTQLRDERKMKIVVSMGAICASGGYYISMAVGDTPDTIFAEPTTWTGSIGVLIPHYDLTGLLDKVGVIDDSIASNPLKLTGSPTRKESSEISAKQFDILKTLVNESFKDFKEIVKTGRPNFSKNEKALDAVATGQVFTAKQAHDAGLVDKIGYEEDAVKQAIALNNLKEDEVRVVKYAKPASLFGDVLGPLGQNDKSAVRVDLSMLLDLTAPCAYYLCSWLPAVAAAGRP